MQVISVIAVASAVVWVRPLKRQMDLCLLGRTQTSLPSLIRLGCPRRHRSQMPAHRRGGVTQRTLYRGFLVSATVSLCERRWDLALAKLSRRVGGNCSVRITFVSCNPHIPGIHMDGMRGISLHLLTVAGPRLRP
ncbi:hypothetical protein DFH06DRAFT_1213772 [Mycena polygramma]|nr:hypothetical protein DFH06DRAFT_1213772 [Mycena polygramma]